MRILLDAEDFEKLVSGEIIERDGVKIALQDIGYDFMLSILNKKRDDLYEL